MLALLVLHRAKLLASNQSVLALGVAPSGVRVAATLSPGTDAGRVCPKALHDAEPTKHTQPFTWKWVFGKDAEIRTHKALHDAKLLECPKWDRAREFVLFL